MITTEDGVDVAVGDRVYNYYDRKVGKIVTNPDNAGWFDVKHNDGTTAYLNGERICSVEFAWNKGWIRP